MDVRAGRVCLYGHARARTRAPWRKALVETIRKERSGRCPRRARLALPSASPMWIPDIPSAMPICSPDMPSAMPICSPDMPSAMPTQSRAAAEEAKRKREPERRLA